MEPMSTLSIRVAILGFVTVLAGCGGGAKIGESCSVEGATSECEDGAVCDKDKAGPQCLKICVETTDCPSTYECNGVSGSSIKACHLKDDTKK